MRPSKIILLLMILVFVLTHVCLGQGADDPQKVYDQIKDVSLDETRLAEVESLVLKRDVAVFRLNQGKICLFQPIQGKVTGAVFVGNGVFEFSPPTEIERYQLRKFTEHETLTEEFEELYLMFSDTTDMELQHKLNFSQGEVPGKFKSIKEDVPQRYKDKVGKNIRVCILKEMLADSTFRVHHPERSGRFFYAEVNTDRLGRLFFCFDPKRVEEVSLEKPNPHVEEIKHDLVCSFHQKDDYLQNPRVINTPIEHENKDEIEVTHYKMEVEIDQQEELSAVVELEYESQVDGIRVLEFSLASVVDLDEVKDGDGNLVEFAWDKKQDLKLEIFPVILTQPTRAGKKGKLVFSYSGKLIDQNWYGDLYIRSSTHWYPRYGYLQRATYDLTFRVPKQYQFVSIGRKVKEWIDDDLLCTQWIQEFPVAFASLNYGMFKVYELEHEEVPPVSVYYLEDSDKKFTSHWNRLVARYDGMDFILLDSKSKENIAADVVNSLSFFQNLYGTCPFPKMAATEIPAAHGQGLPGLLHLSWGTFLGEGELPETEFEHVSFRAHEVSHQWWGCMVGWETYHDQWLSEGFAEYSGAWFAQMSMKDNDPFFEKLKEWRDDIMGKGYKWTEGSKAGPIWLGTRLSSSKSLDYSLLVYEKGAYVLHMLRNMMMDFDNKSDEKFREMMKDFATTYVGTSASTEDFKTVVEKHLNEDMDWFFNQWVYGVDIPTYIFSYNIEQVADKYVVSCEITQENVPEDFKMWVPVLLDFGGDMYAVLRVWVDKAHNKYQLPRAPLPPREVILNPFHAVLCEVKNK